MSKIKIIKINGIEIETKDLYKREGETDKHYLDRLWLDYRLRLIEGNDKEGEE